MEINFKIDRLFVWWNSLITDIYHLELSSKLAQMLIPLLKCLFFLQVIYFGHRILRNTLHKHKCDRCEMPVMYPLNHTIDLPSNPTPYTLHHYGLVHSEEQTDNAILLFIPGNSGNFMQVRTIGSQVNEEIKDMAVYMIDFNEEFVAFSTRLMRKQVGFVCRAVEYLRTTSGGEKIILVGPSMGGHVARLAKGLCGVEFMVTLAVPEASDLPILDHDREFVLRGRVEGEFEIKSGWNDMMVLRKNSENEDRNDNSCNVNELPFSWSDPDHQAIVWSHSVVRVLVELIKKYLSIKSVELPKNKVVKGVNWKGVGTKIYDTTGCKGVSKFDFADDQCQWKVFNGPSLTSLRPGRDFQTDAQRIVAVPGKSYPITVFQWPSRHYDFWTRIESDKPYTVILRHGKEASEFSPLYYAENSMQQMITEPELLEKSLKDDTFFEEISTVIVDINSWMFALGTPVTFKVSTSSPDVFCQTGEEFPLSNNAVITIHASRAKSVTLYSLNPFSYTVKTDHLDTLTRFLLQHKARLFFYSCIIALLLDLGLLVKTVAVSILYLRSTDNSVSFAVQFSISLALTFYLRDTHRFLRTCVKALPTWTKKLCLLPYPLCVFFGLPVALAQKSPFFVISYVIPLLQTVIAMANTKRRFDFTQTISLDPDFSVHLQILLLAFLNYEPREMSAYSVLVLLLLFVEPWQLYRVWQASTLVKIVDAVLWYMLPSVRDTSKPKKASPAI